MKRQLLAIVMAAGAMLSACETAEGYRQQMSTWQGRTGDDLVIRWGPPQQRQSLSDGREVWVYDKTTETRQEAYYRDEKRNVTRTFTDKDGKQKTETIEETFPVLQPARTIRTSCQTRFVLAAQRVQDVTFEGDACVAEERN
jgi:hypothetical protein